MVKHKIVSFSGTIWNRVPKANHVGLSTLCFGVYDAIKHFNYGQKAANDTFNLLNIDPGFYMIKDCGSINLKRKRLLNLQGKTATNKAP